MTDVQQVFIPKGLNEDIIRRISALKEEPQWLLDFRLDAFRRWQGMEEPRWGHLDLPKIDYQDIIYILLENIDFYDNNGRLIYE